MYFSLFKKFWIINNIQSGIIKIGRRTSFVRLKSVPINTKPIKISIQKTAKKMVKYNLVQMIASDAHGVERRSFCLKECYKYENQLFDRLLYFIYS